MKIAQLKISTIVLLSITIAIGYCVLSAGYGVGHLAIKEQEQSVEEARTYANSHVDVIYERICGGNQDFLHLEIDTTYHKIGKRNYTYKRLCNRDFSLREYDGEYRDCKTAYAKCFITGDGAYAWEKSYVSKGKSSGGNGNTTNYMQIAAYKCYPAVTTIADRSWQAWYTDLLPQVEHGAETTDDYRGLILHLTDIEGEYTLQAKYINIYIG